MNNKSNKLIFGIGTNDADYVVRPSINGKVVWCPFYRSWTNMLQRCYSEEFQARYPTYIGCSVCREWLTFSNFKAWMETKDWEGNCLDKDLLVTGNKIYSPKTCVFVDGRLNTFIINCGAARGGWPIGVDCCKRDGKFRAKCRNPFSGKLEHLGYFNCPDEAHQAWRKRKHELACQLADLQTDMRVAAVLRNKYISNLNNI